MTTGPDRNVGGGNQGNQMAAGFDVLVQSVSALNASVRQLSQDMQRNFDAQARYTPGQGGDVYRQARDAMDGQVRTDQIRGSANRYNPAAGVTNPMTMRHAAMSVGNAQLWALQQIGQRIAGPGQDIFQIMRQQTGGAQQPYNPQAGQTGGGTPPGGSGGSGGPGGGGGGSGGGGAPPQPPGGPGGPGGGPQFTPSNRGAFGAGFAMYGARAMGGASDSGGGWTNMLVGGASKLPYVGLGIGITARANEMYLSEREKSRLYQGMQSGGNLGGIAERMREETYRWSLGMGMSGKMARRSFKGVTAMGYTDQYGGSQGRQDALDFIYHNYNARGMDPEESLSLLQTASKDATVNFKELSNALKDVSDSAGKAGVNAKFMRQNFQQMLGTSINQGTGPGATDLARIFTSTQASYGRQFQGQDFTGQLSTDYQYMVGSQYGLRPGQVQGMMRNRPDEYARMVSGSQMNWIKTFFRAEQIQQLQDLIKKYGTSQVAIAQIEQEFLNANPDIDLHMIAMQFSGVLTGVQLDESNVMDWVIQQIAGNTAAAHARDVGNERKPMSIKDASNARTSKFGLVQPPGNDTVRGTIKGMNVRGPGDAFPGARFFSDTTNKAGESYLKQFYDKGKRDPVLEGILQNLKNPNDTKIKVSTAAGDRVVSFNDAMRLFPNELASGKAQIVSGEQAGKSISDVVGGNVDPGRDIRGELTSKAGQKAGQSAADWEKKHPQSRASETGGQRVTVDLSDEAKRVFKIVTDNEAAATGYPNYNPNAARGSRP